MKFEGIPPECFDFLMMLRFHNNREWFQENKQTYLQKVKLPLYTLAAALSPAILQLDNTLEVRPERVVSRIYRDARRLRGRPFYRSEQWFSFKRHNDPQHVFSFYFYLDPEEYGWGCGLYADPREVLPRLRTRIAQHEDRFLQILHDPALAQYQCHSQLYKQPKPPVPQAEELAVWSRMKNPSLDYSHAVDTLVCSAKLLDTLQQAVVALTPFYRFVNDMDETAQEADCS